MSGNSKGLRGIRKKDQLSRRMMRKVTAEERQVFLEHPELVMFNVKYDKKGTVGTIALISVPSVLIILGGILLCLSPLGESHPTLTVALSVILMIVIVIAYVPLFIYIDNRRMRKEEDSHYINLLRRTLPEDLTVKFVTIKYVVVQQCEGAYIDGDREELFGYSGYRNIFPLEPGTEVALVTDNKDFWAFVKRDDATESLFRM